MKIRWRQYELFLAVVIFFVYAVILLRRPTELPGEVIDRIYGEAFLKHHMSYSFLRNFLLPEIGRAFLALAISFYVNLVAMGRIKIRAKFETVLLGVIAPILVLVAGFSVAQLFKFEYLFRSPDGSNLPFRRLIEDALTLIGQLAVFYGAYFFLRELYIRYLERPSGKQTFRIRVANQVGLVVTGFILGFSILVLFKIHLSEGGWTVCLFFLPPAAILFFINLYWLFPFKQDAPFLSYRMLSRWVSSVTVVVFPFCFFNFLHTKDVYNFLLVSYLVDLGIVTPLSWLVYLQQKDKILELRGLQAALGRSTADLAFLRSQINPHFLFNTLNSLYGTALLESAGRTAEGIQRLGDMMRFMLHENHLEKIDLDKETDYLRNYIALQELRIGDSPDIQLESRIDGPRENEKKEKGEWLITPMLLIPFVENAFKHGISMRTKSWIRIELHREGNRLVFDVSNSLHPKTAHPVGDVSGIGLENVRQRLRLAYPDKHQLLIEETATSFSIHLVINRD